MSISDRHISEKRINKFETGTPTQRLDHDSASLCVSKTYLRTHWCRLKSERERERERKCQGLLLASALLFSVLFCCDSTSSFSPSPSPQLPALLSPESIVHSCNFSTGLSSFLCPAEEADHLLSRASLDRLSSVCQTRLLQVLPTVGGLNTR